MKPCSITQLEQMLAQGCAVPGCTDKHHDELYLHQRCHPRAGLGVRYGKGTGVVNIICRECKQPVLDISVALI